MLAMTTTNTEYHIVVAALGGKTNKAFIGYTAVTAPLTYDEALKVWTEREQVRSEHSSKRGSHVLHYAVRSVADPRFAPLVGRGFADAVSTYTDRQGETHTRTGRERGIEKAAKAWAKLYGYEGRAGGWIYDPSGESVTQGWTSFAGDLRRAGKIAQGADGLWYVIERELVK